MQKLLLIPLLAAGIVTIGCAPSAQTPVADKRDPGSAPAVDTAALRQAGAARLAAISAGNLDGYLAAYAADAVWMPANADDIIGKEVAKQRIGNSITDAAVEATSKTEEQVVMAPDWVMERGSYQVARTPKAGGDTAVEVGSYLTVWKKQSDQTWKISYDIWHGDRPAQAGK
jgi:ketosteroid isomerase-like protein